MTVMFGLFGKKEAAAPEERLASLQSKKDWAGLVKAYYELGTAAMEQGDLICDTICSAHKV